MTVRRAGFDEICDGWGRDGLGDLVARIELLVEYWRANFPLSAAEVKVAHAMTKRLGDLGGIAPVIFQ
jgi:hypothetical protein